MTLPEAEIKQARDVFLDALMQIQVEGRSLSAFSSAMLLAACELYDEAHDGQLPKALAAIIKAREIASGRARSA